MYYVLFVRFYYRFCGLTRNIMEIFSDNFHDFSGESLFLEKRPICVCVYFVYKAYQLRIETIYKFVRNYFSVSF